MILKGQLLRRLDDPTLNIASIIPTDRSVVPNDPPALDVPMLTRDALANRPDLAQAALQVRVDEIADRALGNLLEQNSIILDDAIRDGAR